MRNKSLENVSETRYVPSIRSSSSQFSDKFCVFQGFGLGPRLAGMSGRQLSVNYDDQHRRKDNKERYSKEHLRREYSYDSRVNKDLAV
jgi:hypothetical protein